MNVFHLLYLFEKKNQPEGVHGVVLGQDGLGEVDCVLKVPQCFLQIGRLGESKDFFRAIVLIDDSIVAVRDLNNVSTVVKGSQKKASTT